MRFPGCTGSHRCCCCEWTEEIEILIEVRDTDFYQSDDSLIKDFSNMNIILKGIMFIVALIAFPVLLGAVLIQGIRTVVQAIPPKYFRRRNNVSSPRRKTL